jgi:hypothetical protein
MSFFKTIKMASVQYWAPDHVKVLADDPDVLKLFEDIVAVKSHVNFENDSAPALSCRYLWSALRDSCQCIGHDSSDLRAAVSSQAEKIRAMIESFSSEYGTRVDDFNSLCDGLTNLSKSNSFGLGKRNLLRTTLSKYRDHSGEVVVVARSAAAVPPLKKFIKDEQFEAIIVGVDATLEPSEDRIIVLTSWPGNRAMTRLLNKSGAMKYIIIGYAHELKWADGFFSTLYDLDGVELLSSQEKAAAVGVEEELWPIPSRPRIEDDSRDISKMAALFSRVRKGRDYVNHGGHEELVPAYYCDFSGDAFAYLTKGYSAVVVSFSGVAVKISEVKSIHNLCDGDVILMRGHSERSVLESFVESIRPDASQLRKQARLWHDAIKLNFDSAINLHRHLKAGGMKISYQTALNWFNGDLAIAPDEDNLRQLSSLMSNQLSAAVEDIVDAKRELERLHIEAGGLISSQLYKALSDNGDLLAGSDTLVDIPKLGQVHVVAIESLESQPAYYPRSKTNKILT